MEELRKPSDLPSATKDKPMGSDEDDEEPQTEPGTSATTQPVIPVLPLHPGPAASSQGPVASAISGDEHREYSDEKSARRKDSTRTVLYTDLYVLTSNEHWTVTLGTHKYAAAAGSFCFVTTERGEQQDMCNLVTMPCVQRSLCLDVAIKDHRNTHKSTSQRELRVRLETCWNVAWPFVEKQQEQRPIFDLPHEKKH